MQEKGVKRLKTNSIYSYLQLLMNCKVSLCQKVDWRCLNFICPQILSAFYPRKTNSYCGSVCFPSKVCLLARKGVRSLAARRRIPRLTRSVFIFWSVRSRFARVFAHLITYANMFTEEQICLGINGGNSGVLSNDIGENNRLEGDGWVGRLYLRRASHRVLPQKRN